MTLVFILPLVRLMLCFMCSYRNRFNQVFVADVTNAPTVEHKISLCPLLGSFEIYKMQY